MKMIKILKKSYKKSSNRIKVLVFIAYTVAVILISTAIVSAVKVHQLKYLYTYVSDLKDAHKTQMNDVSFSAARLGYSACKAGWSERELHNTIRDSIIKSEKEDGE